LLERWVFSAFCEGSAEKECRHAAVFSGRREYACNQYSSDLALLFCYDRATCRIAKKLQHDGIRIASRPFVP
jgi:hypothetical protein